VSDLAEVAVREGAARLYEHPAATAERPVEHLEAARERAAQLAPTS